ncbi:MAG: TonB-dependent receptor plug domain-containing protein [Gemmatimonadales bacterium]
MSLPTSSLVTLALLAPFVASAQEPRDTIRLSPVVVTATRVPVPLDAVAAAVTVMSGGDLRARGLRTVAEALRAIPGAAVVETGSYGGQTALFLRGGESDYVKVLLDGVPLNQPGGSFDFADLTLDDVDRIEVVRGPASVLYGSDAVAGVIQIFTRTGLGPAPLRGEAAARMGRYGTRELRASVVGGGARAAYSASVSRFGSDGLYRYNNAYRNTVVSGRLRVAPDARTEAALSYRLGDDVYHFPTNGAGQPVDSNQFSAERGPTASLGLTRVLGRGVDVQALATLREQRVHFANEPDSPGEDGRFASRDLVRRASGGALLNWRWGATTVLTAGFDYEDERQRGRSVFEASFGSFPDSTDVKRWNRAVYAQALLGLGGSLSVNVGVRVEDNSRFGGYATYRAGLTYRLDEATRFRASAGTGFKEPLLIENFGGFGTVGDPALNPERSRSWEAGLEHRVGPVTLAVTYFDQRFRDLIEYTGSPAPGSPNYFNVAGASADGVEAELDATLAPGLVGRVRYTYLDTRVLEAGPDGGPDGLFVAGRPLLRRPPHTVSPELTATWARARAVLEARWVGARDDLDFARPAGARRVTLEPYLRLNVAAEYDVLPGRGAGPSLALTVRIENLFDDDAREIANFPTRRRVVLAGARMGLGL